MERLLNEIYLTPVATFIFAVTIVTSLQAFRDPALKARLHLHPWSVFREKKYHQVLTSSLIHADYQHLILNSIVFLLFAFQLEKIMFAHDFWLAEEGTRNTAAVQVLAHTKFFCFYLACQIMSDLVPLFKNKDIPSYSSLGASGALSGVVMGAVILAPRISIWGLPGWIFALLYIGYSYYMARLNRDNIGHDAHLFGALAGIMLTVVFYNESFMVFLKTITSSFS